MSGHDVSVTGGAGGVTARCEEIAQLGRSFGGAASMALHSSWSLHGSLFDPELAITGLVDPAGYATFEADLLDALDGLHGLSWIGMRAGLLDGELRAAAAAYEAADQLDQRLHDEVDGALRLPLAIRSAGGTLVSTHAPVAALQAALAADPEAADVLVDALGLPLAIHAAGVALPDGHAVVHPLGTDRTPVAADPPRRLTDLLADLDERNDDEHHGAIDVRILTLPDGTRRAVVDVTGTKSWTPGPTSDITSLTTNGRALTGEPTSYEHGVLAAMRRAGVTKDDPVMIVGHSEGGMVAVEAARDAVATGEFDVTHVVTAGSPIGLTVGALPRTVQVLALENSRDVVPHLDGRANPDEPNVTTVTGARGDGTVSDDHGIHTAYLPLARDTEDSDDVSVRAFLHSADGYFRATSVRTHTFQITRAY